MLNIVFFTLKLSFVTLHALNANTFSVNDGININMIDPFYKTHHRNTCRPNK